MRKIITSKNGTILTPYNKQDFCLLEKYTSTYDPVYHKTIEETGFIVNNLNGQSAFITHSQDIDFIKNNSNLFKDAKVIKMGINKIKYLNNPYTLNDNVVLTNLQGIISDKLLKGIDRGIRDFYICMQTGRGKTLTTIYLISVLNMKTLVTCFLDKILKQWVDSFAKKTNKNMDTILKITSSKMLNDIIENPENYQQYDIFLCTTSLLVSYLKRTDYGNLDKILNNLGIGIYVCDEAHKNLGLITKVNAISNIKHTIYLSADYGQGDEYRERKFLNLFRNVKLIEPPEDMMISMKYTKAIVMEFDSKPTTGEAMSIYSRYGYNADLYMDYQFKKNTPQRIMNQIIPYIEKVKENSIMNYRTLILLTKIDHVDILNEYLNITYPQYKIGAYHSKIDNDIKDEVINNADIIVSTYDSFSTGVDTFDIKFVIGFNQSNKIEDSQSAGRARPLADGSDAIYIMLIDSGFSYCKNKLNKRLNYLKTNKLKSIYNIRIKI